MKAWHARYKSISFDDQTFTSAKVTVQFYNVETEDNFDESFQITTETDIDNFIEGIFSRLKVVNDFNDKIEAIRHGLGHDVLPPQAITLGLKFKVPVLK